MFASTLLLRPHGRHLDTSQRPKPPPFAARCFVNSKTAKPTWRAQWKTCRSPGLQTIEMSEMCMISETFIKALHWGTCFLWNILRTLMIANFLWYWEYAPCSSPLSHIQHVLWSFWFNRCDHRPPMPALCFLVGNWQQTPRYNNGKQWNSGDAVCHWLAQTHEEANGDLVPNTYKNE